MLIRDLSPELKALALRRQTEQGNTQNENKRLANGRRNGNFDWDATIEGHQFWSYISNRRANSVSQAYEMMDNLNGRLQSSEEKEEDDEIYIR